MKGHLLLLFFLSCSVYAAQEYVTVDLLDAKTTPRVAHRGMEVYMSSYHEGKLRNTSDKEQIVFMQYELCAERKECITKRFKIKLNPHSTWGDHISLFQSAVYAIPGHYQVTARTSVSGAVHGTYTAYSAVDVR